MALMQELDAKVNDYMNREWADAKSFSEHLEESGPWMFLMDMVEVLTDFNVYLNQGHRKRDTRNTEYKKQDTRILVSHFGPPENTLGYERGTEGYGGIEEG